MDVSIFIGIALVGIFAHWLKKWCRDEVQGNFLHWLISEPKHTIYTLMSLSGALYTLYGTGSLAEMNQTTMVVVFLAGFSADSAFNKEGVADG